MAYSRPAPIRGIHKSAGFDCGVESLSEWLTRHAHQAQATGSARVFVSADAEMNVAGYYALAAGEVQPLNATERLMKGQPASRAVPVIILARLAVDQRHRGRGLGRSLLQDALLRCGTVADEIGVHAVVVHALGEDARDFYLRFGFAPSPSDPLHLILLMKDLRAFLDEAGGQM